MTCAELVELVTAYLDGSLTEAERADFEAHLALCKGCETYLDQFRKTIEMVGELREESLTEPTRERLLTAFRDWRREAGTGREAPDTPT